MLRIIPFADEYNYVNLKELIKLWIINHDYNLAPFVNPSRKERRLIPSSTER